LKSIKNAYLRIALTALLSSGMAYSRADAQRVNVSADFTAPDDVGKQIASKIRQKIALSPLMTFISSEKTTSLRLKLVTLNPDDGSSQNQTVYSKVLVFHPDSGGLDLYLSSSVGTCGRNKVDQCAETIFADIDEWADAIRKNPAK